MSTTTAQDAVIANTADRPGRTAGEGGPDMLPTQTPLSRSNPAVKALIRATFPAYRGRLIRMEAYTGPRRWTVCWDEGSKDSVVLLDMRRGRAELRSGAPWTNPEGVLALVDQPAASILVVHSIVCGSDRGLTIIVREPEAGLLPEGVTIAGTLA
jgi:hypothetical protein